jgi:plasmid stability protein
MGQVLIRDLDDDVIDRLKTRAERKGHSLEEELRELLTAAAPPQLTPEEKLAIAERIRSAIGPLSGFDIHTAIRHGRDDEFDS